MQQHQPPVQGISAGKPRLIRFNAQMAPLVLAGTKTQTRRPMKPRPHDYSRLETGRYHPTVIDGDGDEQPGPEQFGAWTQDGEQGWICPYGQPGDLLITDGGITLEITGVRVERLQNISEADALAEGCPLECMTPTGDDSGSAIHGPGGYRALWDSIYGAGSWDLDPWVWVVEFNSPKGGAA